MALALSNVERELRDAERLLFERQQTFGSAQATYRQDAGRFSLGLELDAEQFYAFSTRLTSEIAVLQANVDGVRERYEHARGEWAVAAQDRKAVETLDEKQKQAEHAWVEKCEDAQLDEIAQRQHYHETLMQ